MFSPEEIQEIAVEAQASLPQSVSMSPEAALSPEMKAKLRTILLGVFKLVFTTFSGIPLPAKADQSPGTMTP